jgi:hypothetical protein
MGKKMSEQKIIECPDCESIVAANLIAKKDYNATDDGDPPSCIYFLECPVCHRTMVGRSFLVQIDYNDWDYENPSRLWPMKNRTLDWSIPKTVRKSIEEATKCYNANAYSACAVMCGRSIEALCKEHKTKNWQLAKGLKELKDKGIIDGRLFEWSEALKDLRNIGAHAYDKDISKEDARDVLDFAIAICEYVYVLTGKYEKFKKREKEKK